MLSTPAAAEYKRTQLPAGRVKMARQRRKLQWRRKPRRRPAKRSKNTTSSAARKSSSSTARGGNRSGGGGTVPVLALLLSIIIAPGRRAARRRRRLCAADGRDYGPWRPRDSTKREKSRDSEVEQGAAAAATLPAARAPRKPAYGQQPWRAAQNPGRK